MQPRTGRQEEQNQQAIDSLWRRQKLNQALPITGVRPGRFAVPCARPTRRFFASWGLGVGAGRASTTGACIRHSKHDVSRARHENLLAWARKLKKKKPPRREVLGGDHRLWLTNVVRATSKELSLSHGQSKAHHFSTYAPPKSKAAHSGWAQHKSGALTQRSCACTLSTRQILTHVLLLLHAV